MTKKITKYGPEDYKIEETKSVKVVSTVNLKALENDIKHLEEVAERLAKEIPEKKALIKLLLKVKK